MSLHHEVRPALSLVRLLPPNMDDGFSAFRSPRKLSFSHLRMSTERIGTQSSIVVPQIEVVVKAPRARILLKNGWVI